MPPLPELTDLLLPLLAVAALRATDVTLGVCKTTFVVSGRRVAAALFAALEGATWLAAAGVVLSDLSPARVVAFAAGVAAGTWMGLAVLHELRLGLTTVRMFIPADDPAGADGHAVAARIRALGYGATVFDGHGRQGQVHMVLSVVRRREAQRVCDAAREDNPAVFVAVDSAPGPYSSIGGLVGAPL